MRSVIAFVALLAATTTALPSLYIREDTTVNPAAVTGTTCTDPSVYVLLCLLPLSIPLRPS